MNGTAVKRAIQAVVCSCGATEFKLIAPNELYCPSCKCISTQIEWRWKPLLIEANDDWKERKRAN